MEINDTSEVLELLKDVADATEVWEEHRYKMERESQTHGHQTVDVTIRARGAGSSPRYHVSAVTESGQRCAGNSETDLKTAIATTHWYQLDR